jgi:hypothetical protein
VNALAKLLEIGAESLGPGDLIVLPDTGGAGRARELETLLRQRDGFVAFENALLVLPAQAPDADIDLARLNGGEWKAGYWHGCTGLYFFAADALADLFAFENDKVVRFVSETGLTEPVADTLETWAQAVLADYAGQTGWPIAHQWQLTNGALRGAQRLTGKQPFVLGGEFDLENLAILDLPQLLAFRARLATTIRDLPPGAKLRLAD